MGERQDEQVDRCRNTRDGDFGGSDFHSGNTESRVMQSHILAGVSGSPLVLLSVSLCSLRAGGEEADSRLEQRDNRKSV